MIEYQTSAASVNDEGIPTKENKQNEYCLRTSPNPSFGQWAKDKCSENDSGSIEEKEKSPRRLCSVCNHPECTSL